MDYIKRFGRYRGFPSFPSYSMKMGEVLVATYSEACKLSMDGTYDFLWPTSDISAYAGVEGTKAAYMAHVWDAAGKRATAYLGAAGAGEMLGLNIYATFDFTDSWSRAGAEAVTIIDANSFSTESQGQGLFKATFTANKLYKVSGTKTSGDLVSMNALDDAVTIRKEICNVGATGYHTAVAGILNLYLRSSLNSLTIDMSTIVVQQVTDCAATGALIVSTLGGTTRSWTSVDTGFDPNLACDWKIFRV